MKDGGITFDIAISLMGALITYAATGIELIAVSALLINCIIMGGSYALKTDKDQ